MKNVKFLFLLVQFCTTLGYQKSPVEEVYKWRKIEYENLPQPVNSRVGPYGYYMPENIDLMGMAFHAASGLMLVAVGRLRPGTPATVAAFCVGDHSEGSSPKFWPFPNYEIQALRASDFYGTTRDEERRLSKKPGYSQGINFYNWNSYYNNQLPHHYLYQKPIYQQPNPQNPSSGDFRIISVYAVNIDETCNRAYFVDVGVLNYYNNDTHTIQKPALLVYDLPPDGCQSRNFRLIRRVEFPDRAAGNIPFSLLYITLDHQSEDCDDLFIYISNIFGNYILVHDCKRSKSWSFVDHPSFNMVEAESFLVFDKTFHFQLPLGITSLAVGYPDENGDRTAYYVTAASTAHYAVSTKILKNSKKSPRNYNLEDFRIMGYRGCNRQVGRMAIDYATGVLFMGELQTNRISCWNMNKPLTPDNLGTIFQSPDMQYPLQLFIDTAGYLWFNSCQVPIGFLSDLPFNLERINFRFFRVKAADAIQGTVCEDD